MSAPTFDLYQRLPGLVLGFHGCDEAIGESLLRGEITHLNKSQNKYDWLGNGVYFWENDPLRAWEFAMEGHRKPANARGHIAKPFVLGAVIDLGFCLNLSDRRALDELAVAHTLLQASHAKSGEPMPVNKGHNFGARFLDRAVIEMLHSARAELDKMAQEKANNEAEDHDGVPPYDSVRSAFPEGQALYDGAGFLSKNHIQIAVRNLDCIKGYFRPIQVRP